MAEVVVEENVIHLAFLPEPVEVELSQPRAPARVHFAHAAALVRRVAAVVATCERALIEREPLDDGGELTARPSHERGEPWNRGQRVVRLRRAGLLPLRERGARGKVDSEQGEQQGTREAARDREHGSHLERGRKRHRAERQLEAPQGAARAVLAHTIPHSAKLTPRMIPIKIEERVLSLTSLTPISLAR